MKDTATGTMGVGVVMKGVIGDAKERDGSKSTGIPDEGGVEVLTEIGIGSFIGDEIGFRGWIRIISRTAHELGAWRLDSFS